MTNKNRPLHLMGGLVCAFVANNSLPAKDLDALMTAVYETFRSLATGKREVNQSPAVAIKSSVAPEYLICLEDGKKLKLLKRYLRSRYRLTPQEYRAKWKLPFDYPMVAPNYAAHRSVLAKKFGLGRGIVVPKIVKAEARRRTENSVRVRGKSKNVA